MNARKTGSVAVTLLLLCACIGGLPSSLRRDISYEHDKLQNAERQIERSQQNVQQDLTSNAALFADTPAAAEWTVGLTAAREKLKSAEDADRQLAELARRNRADARGTAERLLARERALREAAVTDTQAVESAATRWIGFAHRLPASLDDMKHVYESVHGFDLTPVAKTVQKAEQDWPLKKDALETRLSALHGLVSAADKEWDGTAAARQEAGAGTVNGPELTALLQADDDFEHDAGAIQKQAEDLGALCGQLYNSWDKVLIDLDVARDGPGRLYRERIKTVTTHIVDVPQHTSETSANEAWVNVSEAAYHAVEDDLGMTIAHKDAGLFDSEAQTTPQPAGFAYIAPESQGSNQYGYWTHSGGETFWTFLPQYLLLRELLWNHDYRPVAIADYRGYRAAQTIGRTYYGQTTPASPPRYGSHGTFTQTRYASSRYVQSGGFRGSAYASHPGQAPSGFSAFREGEHGAAAAGENGAGKRFGGSPSGRRFGRSPGGGRRFGGRR